MSNTLRTLKDQVKRYFDANTSLYNAIQGSPEQVEKLEQQIEIALTLAANNARRYAELRHDFSCNDVTGRVTISAGAPVSLDNVSLGSEYGGGSVSLKSVRAAHLVADNCLTPIRLVTRQTEVISSMKRLSLGPSDRYPDDNQNNNIWDQSDYVAIVNGRFITVQPFSDTSSVVLALDGNKWSDDYIHDDDTDFFLQRGFEFMQWQCIVELNHMLLKFVPRQEGTLAPPTQARDIAFENLLICDSYSINGSTYHDL